VILLTKLSRFCVETIIGNNLEVHSLFARHLLMNSHPVRRFYVSMNQNRDNSYAVNIIFFLNICAKCASGETKSHGVPAFTCIIFPGI
jgi:hypothetical protein